MATVYCYHGGSNTSPYENWTKAATTLDVAHAACAAGDTLIVASDHAETLGGATTLSEGTVGGAPIICYTAKRADSTLETMAVGGGLITCGTNVLIFTSPCAYYYGLSFTSANTGNAYSILNAATAGAIKFSTCIFTTTANNAGTRVPYCGSAGSGIDDIYVELWNCTFKYAHTGQRIVSAGGRIRLIGCTVDAAGTVPATWILPVNGGSTDFICRDGDLSALSGNLVDVSIATTGTFNIFHCKLHASVTLTTGTIVGYGGPEVTVEASDSGDQYITTRKITYAGTLTEDITQYRTGGASAPSSDGSDPMPFSWKVTTNASNYWMFPFALPPIYQFYNGVIDGTTKTVTVCYTQNSATKLNNNDIWMEVEYMATSGGVQGTNDIDDKLANVIATPAEQDTDTSAWALDGSWANENPQKMVATIAPREKGYIIVRIFVAKASVSATPIYIDPLVVIS